MSEIGFGCWGIGGLVPGSSYGETDDNQSLRALERAADRGITFFDTAPAYGNGRSERLLGLAFGKRAGIVIATKAGQTQFDKPPDFSPPSIRQSVDASLARLKRDALDVLQLHNPSLNLLRQRPETLGALEDLKRSGKIRTFGLSMKSPAEAAIVVSERLAPIVQANFNLIDHRALDVGLFELAQANGAGVIARTPLAFGMLGTNPPDPDKLAEGDHRANWTRERLALWASEGRAMATDIALRDGHTFPQVALRFCLSYPAVSTVIPGMVSPVEVDDNVEASDAGALSDDDLARIRVQYSRSALAATPSPLPDRVK